MQKREEKMRVDSERERRKVGNESRVAFWMKPLFLQCLLVLILSRRRQSTVGTAARSNWATVANFEQDVNGMHLEKKIAAGSPERKPPYNNIALGTLAKRQSSGLYIFLVTVWHI
jgi:hypothetical protein